MNCDDTGFDVFLVIVAAPACVSTSSKGFSSTLADVFVSPIMNDSLIDRRKGRGERQKNDSQKSYSNKRTIVNRDKNAGSSKKTGGRSRLEGNAFHWIEISHLSDSGKSFTTKTG